MISHTLVQVLSHIKSLLFILYDSLLSLSLSLSQTNLVSVTSSSLSQIFSLGRTNTFSDPLSQSLIQNSGTLSLSVLARSLSLLSHFHFVLSRVYARFPGLSAFLRKIQLFFLVLFQRELLRRIQMNKNTFKWNSSAWKMRLDLKHGQKEQNGFIIADCVFQFEAQLLLEISAKRRSYK